MCIILNYCPSSGVESGRFVVERHTIRAATGFFKACSNIELIFMNVEYLVQFPENAVNIEELLSSAINEIEASILNIVDSNLLSKTMGIDSAKEKTIAALFKNAEKEISSKRAFGSADLLTNISVDQLALAKKAYATGGSEFVLKVAAQKLGNLVDTLTSIKGKTTNIEAMTAIFPSITRQIFEYKTYAYVVSQTYKAIAS